MIEINLHLHRKARIWLEEVQAACFNTTFTLEEAFKDASEEFPNTKEEHFAVELKIPVGGRTIYGFLGAEFRKHSLDIFSIEVYSSYSTKTIFNTSMYKGLDDVYVGLPLIYSRSVKKGILKYLNNEIKTKPKGKLIFNCAAYSEVGSNEIVFENLAVIISTYFFSNNKYEMEDDYLPLFSTIL